MPMIRRARLMLISAALVLSACGVQKEPAQRLIGDVESVLTAAAPEAAKYVPDQLADVRSKLDALKASFAKRDYAAVVTSAPAVLNAAQELATAAATRKDEILKSLNDSWSALSAAIPESMSAVQSRIDELGRKPARKLPAGIDLNAAKGAAADAGALWSKAQAAFAAGNLEEAVKAAKDVKAKISAAAASLQLNV